MCLGVKYPTTPLQSEIAHLAKAAGFNNVKSGKGKSSRSGNYMGKYKWLFLLFLFKRQLPAYAKIVTMYVGFITYSRNKKCGNNSREARREEMEVRCFTVREVV